MGKLKDWLFGKDSKSKESKEEQAITKLKKQINRHEVESQNLLRKINEQRKIARQMLAQNNRKGAKDALTRAKIYEQRYNQTQNTIMNLQSMLDNIQRVKDTAETVTALESAGEVVEETLEVVTPERAEEVMARMEDQRDRIQDMSAAISDPAFSELELDVDASDEIDAELDAMMAEMQTETVGELPTPSTASVTPTETPTVASEADKTSEESGDVLDELASLKKELDESK